MEIAQLEGRVATRELQHDTPHAVALRLPCGNAEGAGTLAKTYPRRQCRRMHEGALDDLSAEGDGLGGPTQDALDQGCDVLLVQREGGIAAEASRYHWQVWGVRFVQKDERWDVISRYCSGAAEDARALQSAIGE